MNITCSQFLTSHAGQFAEFKVIGKRMNWEGPQVDVVDLDDDRKANSTETRRCTIPFLNVIFEGFNERVGAPSLVDSLGKLRQRGKVLGTEILSGPQLSGVNVCGLTVKTKLASAACSYYTTSQKVVQDNVRPIETLAADLMPRRIIIQA